MVTVIMSYWELHISLLQNSYSFPFNDINLLFDSGTNFHKVEKERLLSMMIQNHE